MAKAKKLPSGNWRVQVYDYTDGDGKKHYKSFTAASKKEAEYLAAEYSLNKKEPTQEEEDGISLADAMDEYIGLRSSVLSPRTIMDYKRIRRTEIASIEKIGINKITQDMIQDLINKAAESKSPKTVRNTHGFISAVLKQYRPDFALNTDLPKKRRTEIYIPTDMEVKTLLKAVENTELELPVLLAAFGPMRRGEIAALDTKNIKGNVVHVKDNMVLTTDKQWIIKSPKSYAGDRYIEYPDSVACKWKNINGKITDLNPNNISDKFFAILKKAGLPHFRFHDLRHYSVSVQHAIGIPDAYIMQRGGWENDDVLKAVYRHTMRDKNKQMTRTTNAYFEKLQNEYPENITQNITQ